LFKKLSEEEKYPSKESVLMSPEELKREVEELKYRREDEPSLDNKTSHLRK